MKTILSLLLLTCFALSAQDSPTEQPVAPAVKPGNAAPQIPSPPMRGPGRVRPGGTNAVPGGVLPTPGASSQTITPTVTPAPQPAANLPGAVISPVPATAVVKPGDEVIIQPGGISFTGADLQTVLTKFYAELVGRSVLRSPSLPNPPVFFVNQTPLTRNEAMQAYEALFAMNGVAIVNVGDKFMKAVPLQEAMTTGQKPLITTNVVELPELGQYVTHIVQLKYVKPSEMVQVLTPFQKMGNAIFPIDSSSILVLRDFTENVKRMLEMIEKIDIAYPSEFDSEVIPIKFAKAEEIASALSALSGSGSATTVGTRPTTGSGLQGSGARPGLGGYGQPGTLGTQGTGFPGSTGTTGTGTPSGTSSFSDRINQIINKAAKSSGSGDFQIIGPNKIVADVRSNSLMVFASKPDMITIKKIISQLDVVLAQVLIETIILDVTLSDGHNVGVSYLQKPQHVGNFTGVGALNNTGFLNDGSFSALTNGVSTLGGGFSYLGRFGNDLDVTLTMVASDSSVKVVQKPRIMTSHATAASVFIGSTVPYVSGTYYGGGYGGGPSSSYQQLRVGINLTVTPYINQDGLVVMKIDEAIDEISGSVPITGVGDVPTTTSRTLSAEVAVADRETIVLGGFIRSSKTDNKSGMPILKDIPVISYLFTGNSRSKQRNELLVLMRPTVLRTPELAAAHTAVEKSRLPGIRRAESENEADETKRVKAADKKLGPSVHTPAQPTATPNAPVTIELEPSRDNQGYLPPK